MPKCRSHVYCFAVGCQNQHRSIFSVPPLADLTTRDPWTKCIFISNVPVTLPAPSLIWDNISEDEMLYCEIMRQTEFYHSEGLPVSWATTKTRRESVCWQSKCNIIQIFRLFPFWLPYRYKFLPVYMHVYTGPAPFRLCPFCNQSMHASLALSQWTSGPIKILHVL